VPAISVFFGIIIRMFYNDYEPPHFHAEYQGLQGKFDFGGEMIVGAVESRTARRLIREWALLHRGELEENWRLAKARQPLRQIAPLE
jgi:Domain of unknown function (DUF4160)